MFSEFHILDGGLGSELLRHGIPVHVCKLLYITSFTCNKNIFERALFHYKVAIRPL